MEHFLLKISIMLVPGMFAITCHEVAHGYVAWRLGDPTARMLGRLTLNPLKHIDIFGVVMIFLIGIGWAKPVPVVYENLRDPKKDMVWIAAAGPITNILLAAISAILLRVLCQAEVLELFAASAFLIEPLLKMLAFSVYINVLLAIFNMIPVPPLDGGRVLTGLLPYRQSAALSRIEPFGMFIIVVLVFFTNIFSYVISPILHIIIDLLAGPYSGFVFGALELMMR